MFFFLEENLFVPLRGSFHIGYKRKGRGTLGGYQLVGKVVPAGNKLCTQRTRRLADDYVLSGKDILFNFNSLSIVSSIVSLTCCRNGIIFHVICNQGCTSSPSHAMPGQHSCAIDPD